MRAAKISLDIEKVRNSLFDKASKTAQNVHELDSKYLNEDPVQSLLDGTFKIAAVSLGSDPRIGATPALVPPNITSGEIKLDGLFNPYTIINFSISRNVLDMNGVVAFNVYRKKVDANDLNQNIDAFTKSDFDRISQNTTRFGKFSQERKAQHNIDASQSPQIAANPNLFDLQQITNAQNLGAAVNTGQALTTQFSIQNLKPDSDGYMRLAQINYANQQVQSALKQVYIKNNATVNLYYEDHNVTYGSGYAYSVTAYCKNGQESARSPSISMVVLNLDGIGKPETFTVKQVDSTSVQINTTFNQKDNIKKAFIFKRKKEDARFVAFGEFSNANNKIRVDDHDVVYLTTYIYRIILVNIFGAVSEAVEASITCSAQNVIDKSRSHNLMFPIFLSSQDPHSDGVLLTLYPNDSRVLYYEFTRRNLTAGERKFGVPRNYSAEFWAQNKFFVQTKSGSLNVAETAKNLANNSLPPNADFTQVSLPIHFVDSYVTQGNVYEYRAIGYDLYHNSTAAAFSVIGVAQKNSIRAPINLAYEILRVSPFRIKITWDDDNKAILGSNDLDAEQRLLELNLKSSTLSAEQQLAIENLLEDPNLAKIDVTAELAKFNLKKELLATLQNQIIAITNVSNPVRFQLQRRSVNSANFATFPLTQNQFVIDEVSAPDAVPFESKIAEDVFKPLSSSYVATSASLARPFNIPDYLQQDVAYEYRVAAVLTDGGISAYSDSIYATANAGLPPILNFSASVLNPNVVPCVVVLKWSIPENALKPDYFRIERQVNTPGDAFQVIGNAYILTEFFDRGAQIGNQYIYRIRGVSLTNMESTPVQTTVNT